MAAIALNSGNVVVDTATMTAALATLAAGFHWQPNIKSFIDFTVSEPGAPTIGDRHINTVTGVMSGTAQACTVNHIYEWNGVDWDDNTPEDGWAIIEDVVDPNKVWVFTGSVWSDFSGMLNHAALLTASLLWSNAAHIMDTDLDMNSHDIKKCPNVEGPTGSDAGIEAGAGFDTFSEMGDDAGANAHEFRNLSKAVIAKLDSLGNLTLDGLIASQILETNSLKKLISVIKGTAYNKAFGTGSGDVCEGDDARLSDARTPTAHKDSHDPEDGSDPLDTATPGTIDENTNAEGTAHSLARSDHNHQHTAALHENGGGAEINVGSLSGTLADDQHIIDAEAVTAMGSKADGNPLNHDRYTDGEASTVADGKITTHAALPNVHHTPPSLPSDIENGGGSEISLTGLSGEPADTVNKSLFDAQTILQATVDDTPVAITIAEQQVVGRITSGNIKGLTASELWIMLGGKPTFVYPFCEGVSLQGNQTGYLNVFGSFSTQGDAQSLFGKCRAVKLVVNIIANNIGANTTFQLEINGTPVGTAITFTTGVIGRLSQVESIAIADGDILDVKTVIAGLVGQQIEIGEISLISEGVQ